MLHVSVHGTELSYKIVGEGHPCLVMHGGLGFDHTILHPGLDRLGNECELVYYDHRGHGQSGRPPLDTLTWEQLAHDAEGLRHHRGYKGISLIAHSLGAFSALEYVLRYPQALPNRSFAQCPARVLSQHVDFRHLDDHTHAPDAFEQSGD